MAFNFRPKNAQEIRSKKKPYGEEAADIFSFIKKTYGEIIILDPAKNFSQMKVPRVVKDKLDINALKKEIKKVVDIKGLDIGFGNGSGSGGSSMNALETA